MISTMTGGGGGDGARTRTRTPPPTAATTSVEKKKGNDDYYDDSIEELAHRVRIANEAYHEQGQPVMDDEAFDALLDELARRAPDHPLVKRTVGAGVGATPSSSSSRAGSARDRRAHRSKGTTAAPDSYLLPVELPHPMGSLAKIKDTDPEALRRWADAHRAGQYVVSDKLDGVSALLRVSTPSGRGGSSNSGSSNSSSRRGAEGSGGGGIAVKLYTRGDGVRGRDVSYLAAHIGGLDKIVSPSSSSSSTAEREGGRLLLQELLSGGPKRGGRTTSAATTSVSVRGELVIPRQAYARHLSDRGPARNLVAGVVNAKRSDLSVLRHVRFVPYEVIEPVGLPPGRQLELLARAFSAAASGGSSSSSTSAVVVWNTRLNTSPQEFNVDTLAELLRRRRTESPYDVDGLVIAQDTTAADQQRRRDRQVVAAAATPGVVAFKSRQDDNIAAVAVDHVEWSVSKDGLLKPVVHFAEAVTLSGAEVRKATGFNAGYVAATQVGPGAVVRLTRSGDVIPHILEVVSPAPRGPQLPDPERFGAWEWTPTGVDARLGSGGGGGKSTSPLARACTPAKKCGAEAELQAKLLEHFLRELGVKGVSEGAVAKLCSADIDTPGKLMHASLDDIARVPGFGPGTTDLVWTELRRVAPRDDRSGLATVGDCLRLMKASNAFGAGFGARRLKAILATDPGARVAAKMLMVVPSSESSPAAEAASAEEIAEATPGVQRTTADAFLQGAERFRAFLGDNGVRCGREGVDHLLRSSASSRKTKKKTDDGEGEEDEERELVVAFSGFRDAALERAVEEAGGYVTGSVSRRTDVVVVPDVGKGSPPPPSTTKTKIAESVGVPVMAVSEFVRRFLDDEDEDDDVSSSGSL